MKTHTAGTIFICLIAAVLFLSASSCRSHAGLPDTNAAEPAATDTAATGTGPDYEAVRVQVLDALNEQIDAFNGDVGLHLKHLQSGMEIGINEDELFPTASMIKVPIMVKIFQDLEDGKYGFQDKFSYDPVHSYQYTDDMINQMAPGSEVALSRLLYLMISVSDNTASIWSQDIAGGGKEINAWFDEHGYNDIRVNSRTRGREEAFSEFGWGQTSPAEMSQLMTAIFRGEVISRAASEKMYRIMSGSLWDGEALSQIPPYVNHASKQGAVRQSRSETAVINAPSGDYVFTVITKNQEDESYAFDNEGYVLIREISSLIWNHLEPEDDWQPDPGFEKYW
ncbi:serine hydrolase [Natronogracilivirga saccharolytica]|uniref:beta-lactamase n=1 Tax=Natronogracilivirga saccharolytica TaxID=2812953 RepID=A0A8J7RK83_9BACT|nr:serine hydrolase [Natronogracilivirga saccharolytica]MBP3193255.1 serine hydrolase [Natronogracilivirga saccharolytica]